MAFSQAELVNQHEEQHGMASLHVGVGALAMCVRYPAFGGLHLGIGYGLVGVLGGRGARPMA